MDKLLTAAEVAQLLRIHPSTLYRFLRLRSIPAFRIGGDWRFKQEEVEKWIKKHESVEDLERS